MPTDSDIEALTRQVLLASFVLSAVFGAIAQRTRFCTMGAIADVVNMADFTRLRQWALAAGVAVIGFGALAAAGVLRPEDTIYTAARWMWLSALVGGLLFGIGMVLASGCGARTLVRLGGGNLKSLVVIGTMGVTAYMTLRGLTALLRDATVDQVGVAFAVPATLGHLSAVATGWPVPGMLLGAALLTGLPLMLWALLGAGFPRAADNLLAGLGIGSLVVLMWCASGVWGHVAEHPQTLEPAYLATRSTRMESMTFVAPLAHALDWLMFTSDRSQRLSFGVASVAGVVVGAALQAIVSRRFRWEGFRTTEDLANHLIGAALMGVGGVTAMGCTIGQGLSGLSTLSLTSLTAVAGIFGGALIALQYQNWRLERMA